jgi:hypothetical protein
VRLERLSIHQIIHDGIHYFTHVDNGIWQLIRDLAIKRGHIAKEYIEGKRRKYFPPLNFFLLVAALFVFVLSLQEIPTAENILKEIPEQYAQKDTEKQQLDIERAERLATAITYINKYSNLLAMAALPLTSFIFWLFYKKSKYNYTEHLIAGMYMMGFFILFHSVVLLPISYIFESTANIINLAFLIFYLVFATVFYNGFLGKKTFMSQCKVFCAALAGGMAWGLLSGLIMAQYISNKLPTF